MTGSSPDQLLVFTSTNIYDSTLIDTATGEVAFSIQPVQYSTWVYADHGVRRAQVQMNATVIQNAKGLDLALVGWSEPGKPRCVVLGSSKGERDIAARHHLSLRELFQHEDVDWDQMCAASSTRPNEYKIKTRLRAEWELDVYGAKLVSIDKSIRAQYYEHHAAWSLDDIEPVDKDCVAEAYDYLRLQTPTQNLPEVLATFLLVETARRKASEYGVRMPHVQRAPSVRPRRPSIVNRVSSFGKELLMRARYGSPESDEPF
ncbi:hypothetical protein PENSPDRAFT_753161 [Peniophora sp. CONT]|nr:hypothetical protein PENSPDRAFT_753161 [Peniophora sp. CONT]